MAAHVLGRSDKGIQIHSGHDHCKTCGACFTAGLTSSIHKCPERVDVEVLKVFLADAEGPKGCGRAKTSKKRNAD